MYALLSYMPFPADLHLGNNKLFWWFVYDLL